MKESTYWSWVAELWNWTSMEKYRARFLNVNIWLAWGKIKEGELMENWIEKGLKEDFEVAEFWVMEQVWQGDSGSLSLRKLMRYYPLFIWKLIECSRCEMMKFGGKSCEAANKKSVTSNLIKTHPKHVFCCANQFWNSTKHVYRQNAWKTCD